MTVQVITSESEIVLPDSFECPICDGKIRIDEVSEWTQDSDGNWKAESVKIDCETFPGFDDNDAIERCGFTVSASQAAGQARPPIPYSTTIPETEYPMPVGFDHPGWPQATARAQSRWAD